MNQLKDENKAYKQEKESIENNMLRMAGGMKEFATSFKDQFKKDILVISDIKSQ
jgi:monoamine oxidase